MGGPGQRRISSQATGAPSSALGGSRLSTSENNRGWTALRGGVMREDAGNGREKKGIIHQGTPPFGQVANTGCAGLIRVALCASTSNEILRSSMGSVPN